MDFFFVCCIIGFSQISMYNVLLFWDIPQALHGGKEISRSISIVYRERNEEKVWY